MKLLVTGSSGMLGSDLVSEIGNKYEIVGTYKSCPNPKLEKQIQIDLTDAKKVKAMVNSINPDFIVHCAALTKVDECEENYALAFATNAATTRNLVSALKREKRFIYISTDSVFDGSKGNYSETDAPLPLNNYAKTKLEGERFVERESNNYIIIRTNIFGWNQVKGQSFAEWIFYNLYQKNRIKMFTDVIFTPIFTNTLSLLIDKLLHTDFSGILNVCSSNSISKYNFGIYLAELFNLDKSLITAVSVDSFKFKGKRPKNTSLNASKAKSIFGTLPTVEDELLKFYKKKGANL